MACTICTKSFGFFNKEHGCPVCKYSFCAGCLKYKLVRDGKKLNVCLRCYKLSSTNVEQDKSTQSQVPETPVEAPHLEQNVTHVPRAVKPAEEPTAVSDDQLIRSKLDALKVKVPNEAPSHQPTDAGCSNTANANDNTDIEKRLAALKGVEYKDYKNAAQRFLASKDNRTEEEQVQDLIGRYADESKLDSELERQRLEQDEEIMRRLNALKEFPTGGTGSGPARSQLPDSDSDECLDDEQLARKLAQRYAEEGRLEAKLNPADSDEEILSPRTAGASGPANDDEEELPWCTICNEDAVLRCHGCDNDLYCKSCFKEFHYDEDPREHKTVAFKPKVQRNH